MSKVLTFDVGKHGAMAFKDDVGEDVSDFDFNTLDEYFKGVQEAIRIYKPTIVGCAYPTRFYNVIVFQSKLAAIIELACERSDIPFMEINDSQAKKAVMGTGHAKKPEIIKAMKQPNEHRADALMFARYIFSQL